MKNFDATSKQFSWPYPSGHRLLHSPSLVAVGLSVAGVLDIASDWLASLFCDLLVKR